MVQINFARREVNVKIVYYGPGRSGKTTNLEVIHAKAPKDSIGEMMSIATETDRTLFFDFLPLDLGKVAGMNTKFQLYTVPGQVYYKATRKLVLQGADGVIFVADSQKDMLEENIQSLQDLEENLRENGLDINNMPLVLQWNKRDLDNLMSVEEMNEKINRWGVPAFEAVAIQSDGVFPTLKAIAGMVIKRLNKEHGYAQGGEEKAQDETVAPPPPPAPPAQVAQSPEELAAELGSAPPPAPAQPPAAPPPAPPAQPPAAPTPVPAEPVAAPPPKTAPPPAKPAETPAPPPQPAKPVAAPPPPQKKPVAAAPPPPPAKPSAAPPPPPAAADRSSVDATEKKVSAAQKKAAAGEEEQGDAVAREIAKRREEIVKRKKEQMERVKKGARKPLKTGSKFSPALIVVGILILAAIAFIAYFIFNSTSE